MASSRLSAHEWFPQAWAAGLPGLSCPKVTQQRPVLPQRVVRKQSQPAAGRNGKRKLRRMQLQPSAGPPQSQR